MRKHFCTVLTIHKNTLSYALTKKVIKKLESNNVSFFFFKDASITEIYYLPKRFLKKNFLFFKNSFEYSKWHLSGSLFFSLKRFSDPYIINVLHCFRYNNGVFFLSTFLNRFNKRPPFVFLGNIQSIQIVTSFSVYRFLIFNTLKFF